MWKYEFLKQNDSHRNQIINLKSLIHSFTSGHVIINIKIAIFFGKIYQDSEN